MVVLPVGQVRVRLAGFIPGDRVPEEIYDLARRLLPRIAPGVTPPTVVRYVGEAPRLVEVDPAAIGGAVAEQARIFAGSGHSVGVITPDAAVAELEEALSTEGIHFGLDDRDGLGRPVTLLPAERAKGLEFDAVVVSQPERFVHSGPDGLRLLYIALTRATQRLAVVHHGEPLGTAFAPETTVDPEHPDTPKPAPTPTATPEQDMAVATVAPPSPVTHEPRSRVVEAIAATIADELSVISPEHWDDVLRAVQERLDHRSVRDGTSSKRIRRVS